MSPLLYLLLIPLARAVIYGADWYFLDKVCKKHHDYLQGVGDNRPEGLKKKAIEAREWITEHIGEIKRRVDKAGVENPTMTHMEPVGYGHVQEKTLSALDNMLFPNNEIIAHAGEALKRTRGQFKIETLRSINPIYWLEILFFLPRAIVSASGLDASSKLADTGLKMATMIYWGLGILYAINNPEALPNLIEAVSK